MSVLGADTYTGISFDKLVDRMAEKTIGANVVNAKDALDAYIKKTAPSTATTTTAGVVKQAANIADLGGSAELSDVVSKVNAILGGLKTAGIMEKDASSDV